MERLVDVSKHVGKSIDVCGIVVGIQNPTLGKWGKFCLNIRVTDESLCYDDTCTIQIYRKGEDELPTGLMAGDVVYISRLKVDLFMSKIYLQLHHGNLQSDTFVYGWSDKSKQYEFKDRNPSETRIVTRMESLAQLGSNQLETNPLFLRNNYYFPLNLVHSSQYVDSICCVLGKEKSVYGREVLLVTDSSMNGKTYALLSYGIESDKHIQNLDINLNTWIKLSNVVVSTELTPLQNYDDSLENDLRLLCSRKSGILKIPAHAYVYKAPLTAEKCSDQPQVNTEDLLSSSKVQDNNSHNNSQEKRVSNHNDYSYSNANHNDYSYSNANHNDYSYSNAPTSSCTKRPKVNEKENVNTDNLPTASEKKIFQKCNPCGMITHSFFREKGKTALADISTDNVDNVYRARIRVLDIYPRKVEEMIRTDVHGSTGLPEFRLCLWVGDWSGSRECFLLGSDADMFFDITAADALKDEKLQASVTDTVEKMLLHNTWLDCCLRPSNDCETKETYLKIVHTHIDIDA